MLNVGERGRGLASLCRNSPIFMRKRHRMAWMRRRHGGGGMAWCEREREGKIAGDGGTST